MRDEVVARFLANACPDHHVRGGYAHEVARHTAKRLLDRDPGIGSRSLPAAVVCGDLESVERLLRTRPEAAKEKSGPKGSAGVGGATFLVEEVDARPPLWEPLLYLCFTRLDHAPSNGNAVAIATALLDHGADPNAYFMAGDSRYTALTGVMGEGEEERSGHPRRDELTRLLLDRGAEPYDIQVVYNIHFRGEALWYLKLMHARALQLGRDADWRDPAWQMLSMGNYGSGARWHLEIALKNDDLDLATWCLEHGADPNAAPARDPRFPRGTLHDEAMRRGQLDFARLLERHGAKASDPQSFSELDRFTAACFRLDRDEAATLAKTHPEVLHAATGMMIAAQRDRADVVELLLDLGVALDVISSEQGGERPLHTAAYHGSVGVAKLLIERGAVIDPREATYGATPLGFAVWAQRRETVDVLGPFSRDLWNLAFTGHVDRLRELLEAEPALARSAHADGETPLMRLPGDEAKAVEIVRLFLDRGADPGARGASGRTAAELAGRRGMLDAAKMLSS